MRAAMRSSRQFLAAATALSPAASSREEDHHRALNSRPCLSSVAAKARDLQSRQWPDPAHLLRHQFLGTLEPLVYRDHDQIFEHRLVIRCDQRWIDLDLPHLHATIYAHSH